jgi:hypothetical protein
MPPPAHLPDNLLTKLRDLHARGIPIGSDDAFFHFVPETSALQFGSPTGAARTQVFNGRDKSTPVFAA